MSKKDYNKLLRTEPVKSFFKKYNNDLMKDIPKKKIVEFLLVKACKSNKMDVVNSILEHEIDINSFEFYPLRMAISKSNNKIAKLLIERGAEIYFRNVESGLKKVININMDGYRYDVDEYGNEILYFPDRCFGDKKLPESYTAFHLACMENNMEIADYLLTLGYDINYANSEELKNAMDCRSKKMFNFLLKKGINVNPKKIESDDICKYVCDPLSVACMCDKKNFVEILIKKGADVKANNCMALKKAAESGNIEIVKLLINHGASIHNENNDDDDTVLSNACDSGNLELVKYLVEIGADIHENNNVALLNAAYEGNCDIVEYLLDKGADINAFSPESNIYDYPETVLVNAICSENINVVDLLIKRGVDINAHNGAALICAADLFNFNLVKLFVDNGVDVNSFIVKYNLLHTPLQKAVSNRNYKMVKFLIQKGADVNFVPLGTDKKYSGTVLYCSVYSEDMKIIKLLIANGADVNGILFGSETMTALCAVQDVEMAKYLISNGARIDISNYLPMRFIARDENYEIIKLFVDMGADVNAEPCEHDLIDRAIFHAVDSGCCKTVKLLIDHGAELNVKSRVKCFDRLLTPLSIAYNNGDMDMLELLIKNGADFMKENIPDHVLIKYINKKSHHYRIIKNRLDEGLSKSFGALYNTAN